MRHLEAHDRLGTAKVSRSFKKPCLPMQHYSSCALLPNDAAALVLMPSCLEVGICCCSGTLQQPVGLSRLQDGPGRPLPADGCCSHAESACQRTNMALPTQHSLAVSQLSCLPCVPLQVCCILYVAYMSPMQSKTSPTPLPTMKVKMVTRNTGRVATESEEVHPITPG